MMHRLRDQCISHRKALINQTHAYLLEFGIAIPQGARMIFRHAAAVLRECSLPPVAVEMLHDLLAAIAHEEEREKRLYKRIEQWVQEEPMAQSLLQLDGIGFLTASVSVATAGSAQPFKNGRQFAVWLGLVPHQYSSGGKAKHGGITKAGDVYVRRLLVRSARTVLLMAAKQAPLTWAIMAGKTITP